MNECAIAAYSDYPTDDIMRLTDELRIGKRIALLRYQKYTKLLVPPQQFT